MKRKKLVNRAVDLLFYFAGCLIYAIAVTMFIEPAKMSPGGITGIATVLHYLLQIPTGVTVFVLNIPLILVAFFCLGKRFVINTGIATVILSFMLTVTETVIRPYSVDPVLAALFGGMLMGAGLSLVFLRSATTGGFDIIVKLVSRKYPFLSMGRVYLAIDSFVILLTALCYRNFESALYSALCIYVSSKTLDYIIYGSGGGKLLISVTSKPETVSQTIFEKIGHGATILSAVGAYTGDHKSVLLCAVRRHEAAKALGIIKAVDSVAFTVITDIGEISGYGFEQKER